MSSNLNLGNPPLLAYWPFLDIYLSNVEGAYFMCLTSISTHMNVWKSFMKFGIKKSHEMISYNLSWIALLSEWKYRSSTKPFCLTQLTIIKLSTKVMKGSCGAEVKKMPQSVKNSYLSFTVMVI